MKINEGTRYQGKDYFQRLKKKQLTLGSGTTDKRGEEKVGQKEEN